MARAAPTLLALLRAIAAGAETRALRLIDEAPALATAALTSGATRASPSDHFLEEIRHHVYAGDTALHVAAAAHRPALVQALLARGADPRARNRRGAGPLHYAVDGGPGLAGWDPALQAETVSLLLAGGADPEAVDLGGVAPLHRAVRNRCAAAVRALLAGGADVQRRSGSGATPLDLTDWTTGRSGAGSPAAREQREEIVRLLRDAASARPTR